nr:hypothetical protein [uncultured Celeribacter sp.]
MLDLTDPEAELLTRETLFLLGGAVFALEAVPMFAVRDTRPLKATQAPGSLLNALG